MIEALFVLVFGIACIAMLYLSNKKTPFSLDLKSGSVWSLLLYKELVLIFLPLLLLVIFGVESFGRAILNSSNADVFRIAIISSFSIILFVASLTFFSSLITITIEKSDKINAVYDRRVKRFVDSSLLLRLSLFLFSYIFLSYKHAFLGSIFSGGSVLTHRLENTYSSGLPTQFAYLIMLSASIVSIYAPIAYLRGKKIKGLCYFIFSVFLASSRGDKAPVLICIVLYILSYFSIAGSKLSLKTISRVFLVFFPFLYFFAYFVVSLQVPNMNIASFNFYLVNRLGVGQMSGVFETFSMPRINGEFYWHTIPFASFFVDYIPYDKMLMMIVEGYDYASMGVKNSLFISEAYGIGGWPLVVLSPIIVGFSYVMGMKFLFIFLRFAYGGPVAVLFAVPLYLLSSPLTGGFSSFPFFKGLILNIIHLCFIYAVYKILPYILLKKNNL